ncbi:MAG: YncE family protein, partial [Planctomycetota bacterium]
MSRSNVYARSRRTARPLAALVLPIIVLAGIYAWAASGSDPAGANAVQAGPEEPLRRCVSPETLAWSPDGRWLAVADRTGRSLLLIDTKQRKTAGRIPLAARPADVVWADDGRTIYVSECGAGTVAEIDLAGKAIQRRLSVCPRPRGLALTAGGKLIVANAGRGGVSIVDLASGKVRVVSGPRRPAFVAVHQDESLAVIGDMALTEPADDPATSAAVWLVKPGGEAGAVRLPPNSINVRGIAISPEGRWAYVAHSLGRSTLPTTHLD